MNDSRRRITALPIYDLSNVPQALRQLANRIEHGEVSAVRCVVVIETVDGDVDYKAFGKEPFTAGHAIGLCHVAANTICGG